jgi:hypothetical protein
MMTGCECKLVNSVCIDTGMWYMLSVGVWECVLYFIVYYLVKLVCLRMSIIVWFSFFNKGVTE